MKNIFISLVVGLTLASICLADSQTCDPCVDSDWTVERGWSAFGDILLVRPLGAAMTIANFGIFAVASPFAAMADSSNEVYGTLVEAPADYTFNRELGVLKSK